MLIMPLERVASALVYGAALVMIGAGVSSARRGPG